MAIATAKFPEAAEVVNGDVRRVLMTADTLGGVWQYALELIESLGEHDIEVGLATMGRLLSADQRRSADRIHNLTLFESSWRLEWMDDPWQDTRAAGRWLLELEQYFRPDVVHLNNFVHASLPFESPVMVVAHSCVFSWFEAVKHSAPPEEWNRYRCEVGEGLRRAPLVIAPTSAMLQALCRHYPIPAPGSVVQVVYNGRRSRDFAPGEKEPFVFSAGRLWDEAKNIQALASVAPRLPWPVRVAGPARHPAGGDVPIENVEMLNQLGAAEMADQFARASIYALPARYEPFGLSALEAGLSGCALVLGDIPTLREVWNDCALYAPPDDHEALTATLRELMEDEALRTGYAERARRRAACFSSERMVAGHLKSYCELRARA